MQEPRKIGIIGDYDRSSRFHAATDAALQHAAGVLSVDVDVDWLPTVSLEGNQAQGTLQQFDAFWCAPGSPYQSMEGALQAIRFAREEGRPFFGT